MANQIPGRSLMRTASFFIHHRLEALPAWPVSEEGDFGAAIRRGAGEADVSLVKAASAQRGRPAQSGSCQQLVDIINIPAQPPSPLPASQPLMPVTSHQCHRPSLVVISTMPGQPPLQTSDDTSQTQYQVLTLASTAMLPHCTCIVTGTKTFNERTSSSNKPDNEVTPNMRRQNYFTTKTNSASNQFDENEDTITRLSPASPSHHTRLPYTSPASRASAGLWFVRL